MYRQNYTTTASAIRNRFSDFERVRLHVGSRQGDQTFGADFLMGEITDPEDIPDTDVSLSVEEFNYNDMPNTLYINVQGKIPEWS